MEMREILSLVQEFRPQVEIHDQNLSWGAMASTYQAEIDQAIKDGNCPALVELGLDIPYAYVTTPSEWTNGKVLIVDHHDQFGGAGSMSSIEQLMLLLSISCELSEERQRRIALISANDVGHILSMLELEPPASNNEIGQIRKEERQIQGLSDADEKHAKECIQRRELRCDDRLTIVRHQSRSSVAIGDFISEPLGGPGYKNLIVTSSTCTEFYGARPVVEALANRFPPPSSWSGGARVMSAYWGSKSATLPDVLEVVESLLG